MIIRPSVIFDAGFLLSYSAVIFIVCFYQDLYMKLNFKRWLPDKIWQSIVVSLVAQAGTLPLTISLFNRFPVWFLLTNLIIVPVSSLLIIIACLVPLTFPLVFVSKTIATLLDFLTGLTALIAEKASAMPLASIENIGITPLESFLLFSTMFLIIWYIMHRRSCPVVYPLASLLLFVLAGTIKDLGSAASSELIVYNTIGHYAVGIRSGGTVRLFSDTLSVPAEVRRHCSTRGLKVNITATNSKDFDILVGDERILLTEKVTRANLQNPGADYIVLTGTNSRINRQTGNSRKIKAMILTQGTRAGPGFNSRTSAGISDSIHLCRISGAFRAKL
jgi:hypothetical protein